MATYLPSIWAEICPASATEHDMRAALQDSGHPTPYTYHHLLSCLRFSRSVGVDSQKAPAWRYDYAQFSHVELRDFLISRIADRSMRVTPLGERLLKESDAGRTLQAMFLLIHPDAAGTQSGARQSAEAAFMEAADRYISATGSVALSVETKTRIYERVRDTTRERLADQHEYAAMVRLVNVLGGTQRGSHLHTPKHLFGSSLHVSRLAGYLDIPTFEDLYTEKEQARTVAARSRVRELVAAALVINIPRLVTHVEAGAGFVDHNKPTRYHPDYKPVRAGAVVAARLMLLDENLRMAEELSEEITGVLDGDPAGSPVLKALQKRFTASAARRRK